MRRPNVLFVMTDQQRFDTIAALGNDIIHTPNMDRLVARGTSFTNAYSTCPVCMPARYTIRSGCEPVRTQAFSNSPWQGIHDDIERACGPWLATGMGDLGYRTFGIGKFHTVPFDAPEGWHVALRSEELYGTPAEREGDAFNSFIRSEYPEYAHIEQLMGERTEMYYMPQASPLPAAINQEAWAADRAVEQIAASGSDPWFGFVSLVGPHPPLAPPIPFNRMYDPDRMPNPVRGNPSIDHMDDQIPWMNHAIFAEHIPDNIARIVKARYYSEISFIDQCLGRVLDVVDDNTLVCFFADHGEHMGDHGAWQKESFFEASTRVPFLVSLPGRIEAGKQSSDLVCLTDLFGIATGSAQLRDGIDVLGGQRREVLYGYYGRPGTSAFKIMVRWGNWKYIHMANGGREQLFNLADDPGELTLRTDELETARSLAYERLAAVAPDALDGSAMLAYEFAPVKRVRVYQHDRSSGIAGFPVNPGDLLA